MCQRVSQRVNTAARWLAGIRKSIYTPLYIGEKMLYTIIVLSELDIIL